MLVDAVVGWEAGMLVDAVVGWEAGMLVDAVVGWEAGMLVDAVVRRLGSWHVSRCWSFETCSIERHSLSTGKKY